MENFKLLWSLIYSMLLLQIHNQSMENKSLQNNYDYRNIIKNFVVKHPVFKTFFLKNSL